MNNFEKYVNIQKRTKNKVIQMQTYTHSTSRGEKTIFCNGEQVLFSVEIDQNEISFEVNTGDNFSEILQSTFLHATSTTFENGDISLVKTWNTITKEYTFPNKPHSWGFYYHQNGRTAQIELSTLYFLHIEALYQAIVQRFKDLT
ncbi:MAG: hypothetical protein ACRCXZ_04540 [Patescibacteria group bacterium]